MLYWIYCCDWLISLYQTEITSITTYKKLFPFNSTDTMEQLFVIFCFCHQSNQYMECADEDHFCSKEIDGKPRKIQCRISFIFCRLFEHESSIYLYSIEIPGKNPFWVNGGNKCLSYIISMGCFYGCHSDSDSLLISNSPNFEASAEFFQFAGDFVEIFRS